MALLFYYSHDAAPFGPFSATHMRELAAAGLILATDLVWQDGTDTKVPAARVKNLFLLPVVPSPQHLPPVTEQPEAQPAHSAEAAVVPFAEAPEAKKHTSEPDRAKRVVRIKGGVILSQDGRRVSFAKQCEVCGHKESNRSSAPIRVGTTRIPFFCRPCRKGRTVEIHGVC
jgi:hypothetical protein